MRHIALVSALLFVSANSAWAQGHAYSVPRSHRGGYGSMPKGYTRSMDYSDAFGNYTGGFPGRYGMGFSGTGLGHSGLGGGRGGYGGGYGGGFGGGYGGGYGGRYGGGMSSDIQNEVLHQAQLKWITSFAPLPVMPPVVNYNPSFNTRQSRLADQFWWRQETPPVGKTVENPFVGK